MDRSIPLRQETQFGTQRELNLEHQDWTAFGSNSNTEMAQFGTHSFYVISKPLGVGVGTRGWGQGGDKGVGVRGIRVGFGLTIVLKHTIDFTD